MVVPVNITDQKISRVPHLFKHRARAHWPLCLATGGRVFVADPSTLGRHVTATCGGDMYVMYANALSVAGTSHSLSHT